MTKNQKIAAGCGAVGCLGLIVVAIGLGIFFYWRSQQGSSITERSRNLNINVDSNSNSNSNANENQNSGSDNSSSNGSSVSDDDKHKLFQAASMSQDAELLQKVVKKLGLFKANGTPADDYPQFIKDHITWGASHTLFITSLDTPEKARAYVEANLPD
ncbi:MAG: hypothetical protein JWM21_606 [Acidobacteria bacterium]|nr:hypothetical protein [Acidobacteriota bacterium]